MAQHTHDHPIPARIMHQVNLVCMVVLAATGFYIHKPNFSLFGIDMNLARYLHFLAGFAILLNSAVRIYWALFGRPRDIRYFLPEKENRGTLLPTISYYLFMRKTKPRWSKYNGLQKSIYVFWTIAIWFMGLTGLAMLWKTDPFWVSVVDAFGGLAMIHAIHYLVMWVFVASVLVHVYLVLFEDFKSFMLMFFGVRSEEGA